MVSTTPSENAVDQELDRVLMPAAGRNRPHLADAGHRLQYLPVLQRCATQRTYAVAKCSTACLMEPTRRRWRQDWVTLERAAGAALGIFQDPGLGGEYRCVLENDMGKTHFPKGKAPHHLGLGHCREDAMVSR